jgi:hypothetical protein
MTFAGNHNFSLRQYLAANAFPTTNIENLTVDSTESNIIAPFNGSISTIYVSKVLGQPTIIYIFKNSTLVNFFAANDSYQVYTAIDPITVYANEKISIGISGNGYFPSGNCLITLLFKSA